MFLPVSDCKRISSATYPQHQRSKFQSNPVFRQEKALIEWVFNGIWSNTGGKPQKPTQLTAIFGQIVPRALTLSVTYSGNPKSQQRIVSVKAPEAKIGVWGSR
jgi:hypothetical protein